MARYAAFEKEMLAAFLIAFENDDIPAMKVWPDVDTDTDIFLT